MNVNLSPCQWNFIKTFQIEALIVLITKMTQIAVEKCQKVLESVLKIEVLK